MFERVLVPLDGSELAESAIPYVKDLVSQLRADVFLVHVCPPEHQAYLHMHQIYLNSIAEGLRKSVAGAGEAERAPQVVSDVIIGEPGKVLLDYIAQKDIKLVALTTQGASGFRVWRMGSIADKIIRGVDIPSLLIRIKKESPEVNIQATIRRILLPLDHSDASKTAVPYAVQLAKKLGASITLFSLAQTIYAQNLDGLASGINSGLGMNWDTVDAATKNATEEYLQEVENEIKKSGVEVTHTTYLGVDAAFEILEMEKKTQADLVVMATRGRSPVARWAFGSVAEKVLREGERPILLIRKKGE